MNRLGWHYPVMAACTPVPILLLYRSQFGSSIRTSLPSVGVCNHGSTTKVGLTWYRLPAVASPRIQIKRSGSGKACTIHRNVVTSARR